MHLVLLTGLALSSQADDGWGEGDDAIGFGEAPASEPTRPPFPLTAGATLRLDDAVWTRPPEETPPVAKARRSIDAELRYRRGIVRAVAAVHAEGDLVYFTHREAFDNATFDAYAYQIVPRDVFVEASPGIGLLSLGRQVVAWGEGVVLSPVDVVNPRDLREPGLADLEDLRLPVAMLRGALFPGDHRLELLLVPEAHFGFRSPPAGPYGAVPVLLEDSGFEDLLAEKTYRYEHVQAPFALDQLQAYLRWRYQGAGFDLALYGATLLDPQGALQLPPVQEVLEEDELVLDLDHRRFEMVGHSGAASAGDFLLRWELALHARKPVDVGDVEARVPWIRSRDTLLVDGMAGVQYAGLVRTQIDLEARQGWFPDKPRDLLYPVEATTWALRASHHLFRERLDLSGLLMLFGVDARYGGLLRLDASYEITDGVHLGAGTIFYRPGDERGPLFGLDHHDRVFTQVRVAI